MHFLQYWSGSSSSYNNVCNSYTTQTSMEISGASNVSWSKVTSNPTSITWNQNLDDISFYFWQGNQTAVFELDATNTCGITTNTFGFKSINCGSGGGGGGGGGCDIYILSPNPASSNIQVGIRPNIVAPCDPPHIGGSQVQSIQNSTLSKNGITTNRAIQSISIYDSKGTLKQQYQYAASNKQAILNVSNLSSGVYIVRITDGIYIENHQIVIGK